MIRRFVSGVFAALCVLVLVPAGAHSPLDSSSGMTHLANIQYDVGTDLAFTGNYAIAGDLSSTEGDPAGFRIIDIADPSKPKVVGIFTCVGSQNDVSVWGTLVFLSVDGRRQSEKCDAPASTADVPGTKWEGIRIVDISDVAHPKLVANLKTECGSHTHTLVPDTAKGRVLIYIQSSAPSTQTELQRGEDPECNRQTHNRNSVVEVPLALPKSARVISTPSVAYAGEGEIDEPAQFRGCHDVTVFMPRKLAGAACLGESQIWDISDPVNPKVLSHIPTEFPGRPIDIHHSTAFSWDGKIMVLGDEAGGYSGPACLTGADPLGALWFFDVTDPANPVQTGYFSLPRQRGYACTAHNYNVVPVADRNILVSAWYTGGISIIDFTDPSAPREIGHHWHFGKYEEPESEVWSAYWYNGTIYASDMSRGFDVFKFDDPSVAAAIKLPYVNPQTQEALPSKNATSDPTVRRPGKPNTRVLGHRRLALPATGVDTPWTAAVLLLVAAGVGGLSLRRSLPDEPARGNQGNR